MMATQENDKTRGIARPAAIVAAIRSGGTFLAHALSNHPQIFCDRGEPLHHGSVWVDALKPDRLALLAALTNQTGYQVSMVKLTYTQALHREIWPWLVARQPLTIWLTRENVIRQAVSVLINKQSRAGQVKRPQHTFIPVKPILVTLHPDQVLQTARTLQALDRRAGQVLGRMKSTLHLTYSQVVGGEGDTAEWMPPQTTSKVCEFLGVRRERMGCDLQRVNAQPLRAMLANWPAVEAAVRASEFAAWLVDERWVGG